MTELRIKETKQGRGKNMVIRMQPSDSKEEEGSSPVGEEKAETGVEFSRQRRSPGEQASLKQWEFSWLCTP